MVRSKLSACSFFFARLQVARLALPALAAAGSAPLAAGCASDAPSPFAAPLDASTHDDDDEGGDGVGFTGGTLDGGALETRLQVDGQHAGCGGCAALTAEARGGTPPYTYAWSVAGLNGPGPHSVCPGAPTRYSVTVTDSSGISSGELQRLGASVTAKGSVDCVAPGDAAFSGCLPPAAPDAAGTASVHCETNDPDAGLTSWMTSGPAGVTFVPGTAYHLNLHRVLPLSVGAPVTVDVYGADEVCKPLEKLFTEVLDGVAWDSSYCFTPSRSFPFIVNRVTFAGTLVYTDFSDVNTICTGCTP